MALRHKTLWAGLVGLITGAMWDEDHVADAGGMTMAAGTAAPDAPPAGNIVMFGRLMAGGGLPAFIGDAGASSALQPFFGRNKIGMWMVAGNGTSSNITNFGIQIPITTGTATGRNVATTNFFSSLRRFGLVSNATAGSIARATSNTLQFWRGNAPGLGGFRAVFRWGCSDPAPVAGARTFVGMSPGLLNNADPSTLTNCIGVGTDGTDANLQLIHNDASGTATKIDLGVNFPDHTLSMDAYELALFCPPNASWIGWEVTRLNTPHRLSGVITTDLPVPSALMTTQFTRNNNASALAVGIDVISLYIETDY